MNFLTPEQEMWRATVERFVDEEIGRDMSEYCIELQTEGPSADYLLRSA